MDKKLLKVGSYTPGTEDNEAVIDREYYGQGYIVKDEDAFLHCPDKVCYVPELSDSTYTRQDFLDMVGGQEELAAECFYAVDWQHPETWIEEQFALLEWATCPHCDLIYEAAGEPCPCPKCGRNPEEEQNANRESERGPAEPGSVQSPP